MIPTAVLTAIMAAAGFLAPASPALAFAEATASAEASASTEATASAEGSAFIEASAAPAFAVAPAALEARAAAADAPNILLVNTDDQRADTLDVMPKLRKRFGDGRTFRNAQVNVPSCCPSRATLLTGQYPHDHGVKHQGDAQKINIGSTLPAVLRKAGYTTMMAGKYLNQWPLKKPPPYFDDYATFHGGYERFNVLDSSSGRIRTIREYSTHWLANRLGDFIEKAPRNKPWFAYYAPTAPHQPPTPEPKYKDASVRDCLKPNEKDRSDKHPYFRKDKYDASDFAKVCANQLRTLMSVDDAFDRLLDKIDLSNTLVVYTSDNGFLWGEHGRKSKFVPYLPAVQVPLLMRWPGHVTDGTDTRLASTIDLAPTFLDAAGISIPSRMAGISLLKENEPIVHVFSEYWKDPANGDQPTWSAVFDGRWHYIEYDNGFAELYDTDADDAENGSVAKLPEFGDRVKKMRKLLRDNSFGRG